ncbi:peroxisome proliferator-activated receptor gamma coactivator 1-beta-like [Thalassophryne amazonica]|uniref:peroxisome proliferator-activated receptor gamma coactivator 1-beta-like n=1 Tax=Thalassophryne amazonica TaxID=390379 RepID=UPI001470BA22|nr:peroxisome proliferator-activated receptor gamma coactivator 1-beta-like [Thalassophryne amazonica]
MADCAPLLDEELSSFVFSYLTENSGAQYGEEEVCSDRLDADFPDIDLFQLDTSDFDSVSCLSELQWCNDQPAGASPASIHYSTTDELFEIEEENAALLAALTDSLDGMVDGEVGGLSVFPALGEEPDQEGEEDDSLPLSAEDFRASLGPEAEDPSLLKKLLLTPLNVPMGVDTLKDGVHHCHSNRSLHSRPVRPQVKIDVPQETKPRVVRPAGRLCTELHRHLTTTRNAEETTAPDTDEDEEEEEDEDSESEDDEDEEEGESSSSEMEGGVVMSTALPEPAKPQFSSEKELQSVVELIRYMHTYCLPTRKQQGWERRDRDILGLARSRTRHESSRPATTNSHGRVVLVATSSTSGTFSGMSNSGPRRLPFTRRREVKANSLLRELLQQSSSFDVSKPYRLHSPPYSHCPNSAPRASTQPPNFPNPNLEICKDSSSPDRKNSSSVAPQNLELTTKNSGSFSVRRSLRLASFPSRFAKRLWSEHVSDRERRHKEEEHEGRVRVRLLPIQAGGRITTENQQEQLTLVDSHRVMEPTKPCCHTEKRVCLCLPLNPKSTGESQYGTKPFEQTLSVDLCGTAGLTPPTTPPHKPVEDELFKPGGECGGGTSGGSGSDGEGGGDKSINANVTTKGSSWLSRSHQRKLPEQTELYAQLQRMGQVSDGETCHSFGDHDYCALSLGESRKRSTAILGAILQAQRESEAGSTLVPKASSEEGSAEKGGDRVEPSDIIPEKPQELQTVTPVISSSPPSDCQLADASPPASEEEAEHSSASRSPSPILHLCPDSPASKTDSSENSEICPEEEQSNKVTPDEDDCQVFCIHNLPSSVTQNMLRKRFQVFGKPEDCKVIICNKERCGVIKIRQSGSQRHHRDQETVSQNGIVGLRRLMRKRYIDMGKGCIQEQQELKY